MQMQTCIKCGSPEGAGHEGEALCGHCFHQRQIQESLDKAQAQRDEDARNDELRRQLEDAEG